ncbi:hypothetical protein BEWA_018430 [Theileria equi strain WA]|uniref:Uncharacterized protein n=1 Tax=Theileria equi strain WA TaxID=1537102 RepID=L0AUT9_THEEQ|nr:hypothetical protein BEWA_018430 [Theileria equi strain WA]AFZ78998.1 hypothetical protein BEWA_018430 [Theileria equi strain WA]|eukprot:XP_004828664.1 hypothetical protein BEWA_018430 [Theileria equi strain WA]
MEILDLFANDDIEEDNCPGDTRNLERQEEVHYEHQTFDVCEDSIDIFSSGALEKLAELNPNLILPYVLPLKPLKLDKGGKPSNLFSKLGQHFIHIQMPFVLPALRREPCPKGNEPTCPEEVNTEIYQSSRLDCLPSGRLGKLRVHKSGKMVLQIDGHSFVFSQGNKLTCKQRVCCYLEENNEFAFLGELNRRFVASPDFTNLL